MGPWGLGLRNRVGGMGVVVLGVWVLSEGRFGVDVKVLMSYDAYLACKMEAEVNDCQYSDINDCSTISWANVATPTLGVVYLILTSRLLHVLQRARYYCTTRPMSIRSNASIDGWWHTTSGNTLGSLLQAARRCSIQRHARVYLTDHGRRHHLPASALAHARRTADQV